MNIDLKQIFGLGNTKPPVRIRTKRGMILAPFDEPSRHVASGEEITIAFETMRQLAQSDFELIDSGRPVVEVADPVPPRQEHRPLPDRWKQLPQCFTDYWNLTEEFRTAREHVSEIILARMEIFGTDVKVSAVQFHPRSDEGGIMLAGKAMTANPRHPTGEHGVFSTLRPLDTRDPKLRKLDRLLTIGEDASREFYQRLVDAKSISLQRAFLACGQHRLKVADELREVLEELATIGFELFSVRTAALGLADFQIRRLYHGSADFQKYADLGTAVCGFVRSAGLDATGQPVLYSDEPAASQAQWALSMSDRLTELKPLLAEGRKELTKAKKVTAQAA